MEIFSYHEGLKKWVEVGNSGLFRPEMLLPMGLPSDVRVIAWGLSLERPTMIKFGIDNIRDLVGHKVNLQMVQENPLCRLDKSTTPGYKSRLVKLEERQEKILTRLHAILNELQEFQNHCTTVQIVSNTRNPLLSILVLQQLAGQKLHLTSLDNLNNNRLKKFFPAIHAPPNPQTQFAAKFAWKDNLEDPELIVSGHKIQGEVNIARYFAREFSILYDDKDPVAATIIDQWLDLIHVSVLRGNNKEKAAVMRSLNSHLGLRTWLVGKEHSLADALMWSAVYQTQSVDTAPHHVQRWLRDCSLLAFYGQAIKFVADYYEK